MVNTERIAQAERLVQWGSSDERIEAITGLSLNDILALRARLATPQRRVVQGVDWPWRRDRTAL